MKKILWAIALLTLAFLFASCNGTSTSDVIPGTPSGEDELKVEEMRYPVDYELAETAARVAVEEYVNKGIEEGVCLLTSFPEVDGSIVVIPRESGVAGIEEGADFVVDVDLYSFSMTLDGEVVGYTRHNPLPIIEP